MEDNSLNKGWQYKNTTDDTCVHTEEHSGHASL